MILEGDCLTLMPSLQSQSVDLIITDLPYGVTQNPADVPLPLDALWREWKRLLKPSSVLLLTSQLPFTADLIISNRSWFRYDLVWDKMLVSGHLNANRMPLRVHELILVFSEAAPKYFPQKSVGPKSHAKGRRSQPANRNYGSHNVIDNGELLGTSKYPTSIIAIRKPHPSVALHPTEKPVELARYLIETFSQKGDVVLDCCMGAGWSAVASRQAGRKFIGIELQHQHVETAKGRLQQECLMAGEPKAPATGEEA